MPETATDSYKSDDEFYEDKDEMIGRHWLDPEDYRQTGEDNMVVAIVFSIAFILAVGAAFLGIIWLSNHTPIK